MNLSPHFTLEELTRTSQPFPNVPGPKALVSLKVLCVAILEPVRAHFGKPVHINSGYRSPKVNAAVGSKPTSQHALGEAADIEIPGVPTVEVARWIRDSLAFDQVICENYHAGQPNSGWTHVSYRVGRARKSVLTMTLSSHGAVYTQGLPE